ncbi:MAG: hypothetical protein LBT22_04600 [Peptococcaceae bacterium]|nr:hypothetical protein [Peptococcaceae bacterium]
MKTKISDLLDRIEHYPRRLRQIDPIATEKVKELTMRKINTANSYEPQAGLRQTRAPRRAFAPILAAMLILAAVTTTALAATGVIWQGIFGTADEGINTAVEYDYVQNVAMDYVVSNGVGVRFESVMLDNSTLNFVVAYQVPEAIPLSDWINSDITITDESGIVLYGEGKGMLSTGGSIHVPITADGLTFKMSHIAENVQHTYPASQKLYVEITNIKFFEKAPTIAEEFNGHWSFEIDMADKFVDRTALSYRGGLVSGSEIVAVSYANLTHVSFDVEFELSEPHTIMKKIKLMDSNGQEYESKQIASDDGNAPYLVRTSFPVTLFKTTPTFTLYYGGSSIELIRSDS